MNKSLLYSLLTAAGVAAMTLTPTYYSAVCSGSAVTSIFGG